MPPQIDRRTFVATTVLAAANRAPAEAPQAATKPYLTPASAFEDVSRGDPIPHTLKGAALAKAKLTPETWRLRISVADTAKADRLPTFSFAELLALGKQHGVRFLKAIQCNNLCLPLGQGLWEGVPLPMLLRECGGLSDVRRVRFWGFHNDKADQRFQGSLALNQALEAASGELPPVVAYRLNGKPIPLERGGPVRMIVPWTHGFKNVKWLQELVLTNDYHADDTYALENNDPESRLKSAAYPDRGPPAKFAKGDDVALRGVAIVGWSGLRRIEIQSLPGYDEKKKFTDADWSRAPWRPATIEPAPTNWGDPTGPTAQAPWWDFDASRRPKHWPMRFCVAYWNATIGRMGVGKHAYRVRAVDENDFAQPEPRAHRQSGDNSLLVGRFDVT